VGRTQQKLLAGMGILLVAGVILLKGEPQTVNNDVSPVITLDVNHIEEMVIDSLEGSLHAKRTGDGIWTIEQPFEALGSTERFELIVTGLNELQAMEPLESTDYEQFGLSNTVSKVEITLDNQEVTTIYFGHATPVGENRYVRVDDGPVLVAQGPINNYIGRSFATYPADVAD